jgi:hypothetical protein
VHLAAAWITAAAFVTFMTSTKLPYYLVIWAPWPVLLVMSWVERNVAARTRQALLVLAAALVVWLPCATWNLLRCREAFMYGRKMTLAHLSETVHAHVPANARVVGSPELFAYASEVGLDFVPLPYFGKDVMPEPTDWLLFSTNDLERTTGYARVDASALSSRSEPLRFDAFPAARANEYPLVLYAPVGVELAVR